MSTTKDWNKTTVAKHIQVNKMQKHLSIQNIHDPYEKKILLFLDKNRESVYGDIFKELRISGAKGQEAIYSLFEQGLIRHKRQTNSIELNVEIKNELD